MGFSLISVGSLSAGAFCSGADLKERREQQPADIIRFSDNVRDVIAGLAALPVPVLAAVDGAALGGGAELALAADVRTVSVRASMGFPETGLGIIPGVGGAALMTCPATVKQPRPRLSFPWQSVADSSCRLATWALSH